MKAAELEAKAAAERAKSLESFDRCDTDGCLSQWGHDQMAALYAKQAEIERAGGKAEFWGLYDLAGNRLMAKLIDGKYGMCWAMMDRPNGTFSGRFVPFCDAAGDLYAVEHGQVIYKTEGGRYVEDVEATADYIAKARARVERWERKHGVSQRREMAPAVAMHRGSGRGLSGRCWVAVERQDGL